jgi:hypothetical protein
VCQVFQPCGHGGVCFECAKQILIGRRKCPLCRSPIEEVLKLASTAAGVDEHGLQIVITESTARL